MTKTEFQEKNKEILKKQGELQNQINELRLLYMEVEKMYIESNLPCKIGDKAKTSRGDVGIVVGFKVDREDEVSPILAKIKKDGTASSRELDMWYSDTIQCYMSNNDQEVQVSDTTEAK